MLTAAWQLRDTAGSRPGLDYRLLRDPEDSVEPGSDYLSIESARHSVLVDISC